MPAAAHRPIPRKARARTLEEASQTIVFLREVVCTLAEENRALRSDLDTIGLLLDQVPGDGWRTMIRSAYRIRPLNGGATWGLLRYGVPIRLGMTKRDANRCLRAARRMERAAIITGWRAR